VVQAYLKVYEHWATLRLIVYSFRNSFIKKYRSCQDSCKYLVVYLDSKLHFKTHFQAIKIKVVKGVGILSKLRFSFPKSSLLLLYNALIQPHLLFALSLWGTTSPSYLKPLQLLQNKAVRIICNCKRASSATPLFHKLEILKINELCQ